MAEQFSVDVAKLQGVARKLLDATSTGQTGQETYLFHGDSERGSSIAYLLPDKEQLAGGGGLDLKEGEGVWAATDAFIESWDEGLRFMMKDVVELAGRVAQAAAQYAEFEAQNAGTLNQRAEEINGLDVSG